MPPVALQPVDSAEITTLVDNVVDIFMPDQGPAKRFTGPGPTVTRQPAAFVVSREVDRELRAEHGFSLLVGFTKADHRHLILYDAGLTPDGLAANMRCLGVSPGDVEAVVLSHGHHDHTTGLDGFVRAVGRPNMPVLIHPEFWTQRRLTLPGREPMDFPSPSRSALEDVGFEIVEQRQPSFLLDGCLLVTGEIDRTNDFEKGFPLQEALRGGKWVPDPLVLDDQALVLNVRDRGLVVMTGCGHAGVVNTVRYAQRLTGIRSVYAIIGGFHLSGPLFEPLIPVVCNALATIGPEIIVPSHCTGWRAVHRLATVFPDAFIPNCVGTRFEL